jgi:protein-tyrosine phosphatase
MTTTPTNQKRILFLCTGNYYRSRFAEIFFNWHAPQRGLLWTAESRGLALDGWNYGPISRYTVDRLKEQGIAPDPDPRFPLPVSEADLAAADHIVAVKEAEHRPVVVWKFPAWTDRIEYWNVHDLDCSTPDDAFPHLEQELRQLIDRLAALTAAGDRSNSILAAAASNTRRRVC